MNQQFFHSMMRSDEHKPTRSGKELTSRLLVYAKPYSWHLAGMLLAILATTGIGLLSPILFRNMIDQIIPAKDYRGLAIYAGLLFAIPLLKGAISIGQRKLNATVGEGVIYQLRVGLYAKLQSLGIRFFTHTHSGELMSRLNSDVVGAQNAISNTIVSIVTNTIQAVFLLIVMLGLQWQLTLAGLVILPFFIILSKVLARKMKDIAQKSMEYNAIMNAHMNETLNIGGVLLTKLFGRQSQEVDRFDERASKVRDIGIDRAMFSTSFFLAVGLLGAFGTAITYGVGGWLVIENSFTVGTIVAFIAYLDQLYGAMQSLANAPVDFSTSLVSFERVFEILDLGIEVAEKESPIVLADPKGRLEFKSVGFSYASAAFFGLSEVKRHGQMSSVKAVFSGDEPDSPPNETVADGDKERPDTLTNISFVAEPGKLVALVGPSGAGKTTTTYLVPRLYDPTDGQVTLDGIDLRDLSLESLAAQIGMVTQENYLFHDTIRTNITYGRPNATQPEIEQAAKIANIHTFISSLPKGYDTIVGERGYRLSGGEKQRIALARVILKDPRILVLDEATSSLDSESESLIQQSLKIVMKGRTSIVIAHRLSTILAADEILVMDKGTIVERGTHAQLLAKDGLYRQLFETQFKDSGDRTNELIG